ncbi:MAG: glycosyltransferase family 4 protein [Gemmatimonadota bacterium]|nr:MAG: glycosyltransferase family 4 protein [Gemmatimonadota bacterium]
MAERRRILVLADVVGGGTGKHLQSLIRHWIASGWEVRVLTQNAPTERMEFGDTLEVFPPRRGYEFYPLAQLRRLKWLRGYVRHYQPALVHSYFFWSIMYGRALKRSGAVSHLVENREDQGFGWGKHEYALLRLTATVPDHVIAVSEAVRTVALERERLDPARTSVIHNGVPASAEPAVDRSDTVRLLGLDDGDLIVGMVSNLNRAVKGARYFVEAIPQVVNQEPRARFVIFGYGDEEAALADRARELGVEHHLILAGYREDMPRFYAAMDVSVLTSLTEGLSIALLESMSYGLPVVVTRVGGNPELVLDGETGFLVPPKDTAAFAEKLVCLLRDPELRARLGSAGRKRVDDEFRLTDVAARYLRLYERLL